MSADPRPQVRVVDGVVGVDGVRCGTCGYATALPTRRCPVCGGRPDPARFGPEGTVWSHTVVRIPYGGRTPPYGLAYADLEGGARLLVHLEPGPEARVGGRVRLTRSTPDGDPVAEVLG